MNEAKNKTRRKYGAELKQHILAECAQPGASVATVALSHGINANVVHKWRRQASGVLPVVRHPLTKNEAAPIKDFKNPRKTWQDMKVLRDGMATCVC